MTVEVSYTVLVGAGQVLARQESHCRAIETSLRAEGSLHDPSGLLLSMLAPGAHKALDAGCRAVRLAGQIGAVAAAELTRTIDSYVEADARVHGDFGRLASRIRQTVPAWVDPRVGTGVDAGPGASPAHAVAETTDPRDYLVTPQLGRDEVHELRQSAASMLGSLDWLATQFLGFSILDELVLRPFGGDWQDVTRAALAWQNAASAVAAISENVMALTSATVDAWTGAGGDAFRAAMATASAAFAGFSRASSHVSELLSDIARVSHLACVTIEQITSSISTQLLILAAEASIPIAGWASDAAHTVLVIQDIVTKVRSAQSVIELVIRAINAFLESEVPLGQALGVIEDLADHVARRAVA